MRLLLVVLLAVSCSGPAPQPDAGDGGGGQVGGGAAGGSSGGGAGGGVAGGSTGGGSGGGASCSGCMLNGMCKAGTGRTACGAGGVTCDSCSDNETCSSGACVITCDDTTCGNGCCSAGGCVDGGSDSSCGGAGGVCSVCATDQHCVAATCTAFARVDFTYYLNGPNCSSNPSCTTMKDFAVDRAANLGLLYADAGCAVTETMATPDRFIINCLAVCNHNSVGGCCGGYPKGADSTSCMWTPPP